MLFRILVACGLLILPLGVVFLPELSRLGSKVLRGGSTLDVSAANSPYAPLDPISSSAGGEVDSKPTLMIFTASWCPPCKQMKASVYHSPEVESVSDRVNWVFVDIDLPENRPLVAKYGVASVPTYFLQDSAGKILRSQSGGSAAPAFRDFIASAF